GTCDHPGRRNHLCHLGAVRGRRRAGIADVPRPPSRGVKPMSFSPLIPAKAGIQSRIKSRSALTCFVWQKLGPRFRGDERKKSFRARHVVAALFALAASFGCAHAQTNTPIKVVASFSILADFVRSVGQGRIELATLVGPLSDAHVYVPT